MKLIVLRDNLKNALDIVGRAVGSNASLPVLNNILIKAQANQIKVSATNLELAIMKGITGKIIEEGSLTIPFGVIANIVNNLASERINLETKTNNLNLQTDNYKALIQGLEESEFPILPKVPRGQEFLELKAPLFKEALDKVIVAAGISEIRPELSGVFCVIEFSVIKLVATDSFRLAEAKISGNQFKNSFSQGLKIIVPLKTAQELSRVAKESETIKVYVDNSQILFEINETEIISRVIDGNFPDYEAIVPKGVETEILVEREELINSLKLASAFSGRVNEVRLRSKDKRILEVHSSDSALGENDYLIPAKINGTETEVVFNWRFLLDGIKSGSSKEIFLGLNGESRPALIKSPEDTTYFYILMPIKAS